VVARSLSVGDPDQKLVTPTIFASSQFVSDQVCWVITPPSCLPVSLHTFWECERRVFIIVVLPYFCQYLCIHVGVQNMRGCYHHWVQHKQCAYGFAFSGTPHLLTATSFSPSQGELLALKLFCPDPSSTFSAICPEASGMGRPWLIPCSPGSA
jgi:hypothetical protein